MKPARLAFMAAAVVTVVFAFPGMARASITALPTITITFDEDGHGSGALSGLTWTLRAEKVADPWGLNVAYVFNLDPTVFESALTYFIGSPPEMEPPSLVEGDILLFTQTEGFSDIIRFNYGQNGSPPFGTIVVYSDGDNSYDSLSDVSLRTLPWNPNNALWMWKQGEEGSWSGLQGYTPLGPGWTSVVNGQVITHHLAQPGYMPGYAVTYNFTSEPFPVPVPAAVALGILGLGLVGWMKRRRLT